MTSSPVDIHWIRNMASLAKTCCEVALFQKSMAWKSWIFAQGWTVWLDLHWHLKRFWDLPSVLFRSGSKMNVWITQMFAWPMDHFWFSSQYALPGILMHWKRMEKGSFLVWKRDSLPMYWNESISIQILNGRQNAGAYPKIHRKVDVHSIRSKYWIAWVENLPHFNLQSQVLQAPESSLSFKIYINNKYIYWFIRQNPDEHNTITAS